MQSLRTLQQETEVGLNVTEDATAFAADVAAGRWHLVLPQVATFRLPLSTLAMLYEQVVRELAIDARDLEAAKTLLRSSHPLQQVRREDPSRYARLEHVIARAAAGATAAQLALEGYPPGGSRDAARKEVAAAVTEHLVSVPPGRLLTLLDQAVKWQQHTGMLPPGASFDLFRGLVPVARDAEEVPPTQASSGASAGAKGPACGAAATIRFGSSCKPTAAAYTPDGACLVTGSSDGLIEVYEPLTGRLRMDLGYQARDEFMLHDAAVLALAVSRDSELLASGSRDGRLKVWQLSSGECVRKFGAAHEGGVTALAFSKDGSQVLSGGNDGVARIFGMRSGRTLKEFRGHASFVTAVAFAREDALVVTGSADGSVKVWDCATQDCIATLRMPGGAAGASEAPVLSVTPLPRSPGQLLVVTRASAAHIVSLETGAVTRTLAVEVAGLAARVDGEAPPPAASAPLLAGGTVSPQGKWAYLVDERRGLHCIPLVAGQALKKRGDGAEELGAVLGLPVGEVACTLHGVHGPAADVLGVLHHPLRNAVATFGTDGTLNIWRP